MALRLPQWLFRRRTWLILTMLLVLAGAAVAAYLIVTPYCHLHAAEDALRTYDYAAAQKRLDDALAFWPSSAETQLLAARTARHRDDYATAERHLAACEKLKGTEAAVARERALLRAQQGDLAEVEAPLRELVESKDPDAPLILEALARGYFVSNRVPQAIDCLDRLLEQQPDYFPALAWRGRVWESLSNDDAALKDYERAVSINPYSNVVRLWLADTLNRLGRSREAIGQYECLRQRPPVAPEAIIGLAHCRYDLNDLDEARRLLDGVLAEHSDNVTALVERGWIALHHERPEDGEKLLRRAVTLAPSDRGANLILWRCLEAQGKEKEQAAREVRAYLGKIEADEMRIVNLKVQVGDFPNDPKRRREIGVLLIGLGQNEQGYRWLTSALRLDPNDAETHAALADFYKRVGDADAEARERALARQSN